MIYVTTFIAVAPDNKAGRGTVPPARNGTATVARLEYDLISTNPYQLTQEEVQFAVHAQRAKLGPQHVKSNRAALWAEVFAKPMACMRASPLPKSYGWGLHFDADGKVAHVGVETPEYQRLINDPALHHKVAMRSKRS